MAAHAHLADERPAPRAPSPPWATGPAAWLERGRPRPETRTLRPPAHSGVEVRRGPRTPRWPHKIKVERSRLPPSEWPRGRGRVLGRRVARAFVGRGRERSCRGAVGARPASGRCGAQRADLRGHDPPRGACSSPPSPPQPQASVSSPVTRGAGLSEAPRLVKAGLWGRGGAGGVDEGRSTGPAGAGGGRGGSWGRRAHQEPRAGALGGADGLTLRPAAALAGRTQVSGETERSGPGLWLRGPPPRRPETPEEARPAGLARDGKEGGGGPWRSARGLAWRGSGPCGGRWRRAASALCGPGGRGAEGLRGAGGRAGSRSRGRRVRARHVGEDGRTPGLGARPQPAPPGGKR